MGQYYLFVCPQLKQYIHPWFFSALAKETEYIINPVFTKAVCYLLSKSAGCGEGDLLHRDGDELVWKGKWHGYSVKIVGDYDSSNLYTKAKRTFTNISEQVIIEMCAINNLLCNEDLGTLIEEYGNKECCKDVRRALDVALRYDIKLNHPENLRSD